MLEEFRMQKIKGLLFSMLVLAVILGGCNKSPAENKELTTEDTSSSSVSIEATDWPRTIKDALGKEFVIEKTRKSGFFMVFLP